MCVSPQPGEVPCYSNYQLLYPHKPFAKKQKSTYHRRAIVYTITHSDHDRSLPAISALCQPSPKRHEQGQVCTEMVRGWYFNIIESPNPYQSTFPVLH